MTQMTFSEEFSLDIGVLDKKENLPALLFFDHMRPIKILFSESSSGTALGLSESFLLQLLHQHPLRGAQVSLYESVPGPWFAQVKRLFARCPEIYGRTLSIVRDFRSLVEELTNLAHERYSLLATAEVPTLYEYNRKAVYPEKVRYLLISSILPFADDASLVQQLRNLCLQGPSVGIVPFFLRMNDAERAADLSESARKRMGQFWEEQQELFWGLDLRNELLPIGQHPLLWKLLQRFGLKLQIEEQQLRGLVDSLQAAVQEQVEESPLQDFLNIPIGYCGHERFSFRMGDLSNNYHAMIAGANRSGKTTMLNNVILSACESYSPDQLRMWLFDFKNGVSFNAYDELPHADVLFTDNSDKGYLLRAFKAFIVEMSQRAERFKRCKPPVATLPQYNAMVGVPLPRLVMLIDEAQSLFDDRETKVAAREMIREISRKGAAFGLHLILITQSYQNVDLDRDAQGQIGLRIALQLANSMECRYLMGRDNDAPMHLSRFHAIYNNGYGDPHANRQVRLDPLDNEALFARLEAIRQKYPNHQGMLTFDLQEVEGPVTAVEKTAANVREIPEWLR